MAPPSTRTSSVGWQSLCSKPGSSVGIRNPSLVLVQPRKTRPFITERLLMGRKESNQTNKQWESGSFRPRSSSPPRRFAPAAFRPRSFRPWSFRPPSRFTPGRFAPRIKTTYFVEIYGWLVVAKPQLAVVISRY